MKELTRNQRGFSLVELMVATGVLGMLALAVSQLTANQMKSSKTVEKKFEVTTVFEDIRTVLSDQESCTNTLAGRSAISTPAGSIVVINRWINSTATERFRANPVFASAPKYGGGANVRIHSFRITGVPGAGPNAVNEGSEGKADLFVRFHGDDPTKPKKTFASEIERRISLNIRTNAAGNIVTCSSAMADNSENDFNLACQSLDGTPNQPSCTLQPFPGTLPAPGTQNTAVSTQYLNDWWSAQMLNVVRKDANLVETMQGQLVLAGATGAGGIIVSRGGVTINNGNLTMGNGQFIQMNSDRRLKKNIRDLSPMLSRIRKVEPKQYGWKTSDAKSFGFIAQQIAEIFPELVHLNRDSGYYAVDYIQFTPLMLKAMQEVDQENQALKREIKDLKADMRLLKQHMCSKDPTADFCG